MIRKARRWWTVYWLLQSRCGATTQVLHSQAAMAELTDGAPPAFPAWLQYASARHLTIATIEDGSSDGKS